MKFIMQTVDCPTCKGYGTTETLIGLSYDGDQTWRIELCERCFGEKTIEEPMPCAICDESVKEGEEVYGDGAITHRMCRDEQNS